MIVWKEIAKPISGLKSLESIGIGDNEIDSQGALEILAIVKNLKSLKEFYFFLNLIDESTKARVKKELKKLRTHPIVEL